MKFMSGLFLGAITGTTVAFFQNSKLTVDEQIEFLINKKNKIIKSTIHKKNDLIDTKNNLANLKNEITHTLPETMRELQYTLDMYKRSIEPNVKNLNSNITVLQDDLEKFQN